MDMRLFLLKKEGEEIPLKPRIKIVSNLNSFSDEDVNFEEFTSLKALFTELSAALKQNDFIVIAISSRIYNKTKIKLMSALSLDVEKNALVEQRISKLSLDEDAFERNVQFPVDAVIFPSDDGLNSGFAIKKGKQNIVILPLDEQRTDAVVKKGLVPYITGGYIAKPAAEDEAPAPEEPEQPETTAAVTDGEKQVALRTLNLLKESGKVIAVNANANAEMLRQFAADFDGFDEHFVFTPHIEDRGDYNVTDYTAQMARSAKGLSSADYGACISDIFTTDEVDYICIAVATDKSALVRKLYREDDETDEQFIMGATEELFALIGEKAAGNTSVGLEIAQDEAPERKGLKKSAKIIIAIACVLLVAALAVGTLFFIKYRSSHNQPETTTEPISESTTAKETTTEPPKKINAMTLSQLIMYELENGIQNDSKKESEPVTETTTAGAFNDNEAEADTTKPAQLPVNAPTRITVNGVEMDAREAIARIVEAEMETPLSTEAIKAQAVVAYTYLKYRNTNWTVDNIIIVDTYSQEIYDAVNEVFGQYLRYGDDVAFTPFHRMSAGRTASSELIFGKPYDYLVSVLSTSDKKREGFKVDTVISTEELKNAVLAYDNSITLGEDPATWLEVVAHDGAMNGTSGYVEKLKIGDKEVSGMTFVYKIMTSKNLNSPCFSVKYSAEDSAFTFTTYGQGYGVGMSQLGADRLAEGGRKYDKILDTYYPKTILETESVSDN